MFTDEVLMSAERVLEKCRRAGILISTAESCTGGLIVAGLTAIAGSSDVVDRGFVTYTNEAKYQMLGVSENLIKKVGAVSEEVARAMAEGALARSDSQISISVTGIAGPGGGSADKPVGLVHMGLARSGQPTHHLRQVFTGDRSDVRNATVLSSLFFLNSVL